MEQLVFSFYLGCNYKLVFPTNPPNSAPAGLFYQECHTIIPAAGSGPLTSLRRNTACARCFRFLLEAGTSPDREEGMAHAPWSSDSQTFVYRGRIGRVINLILMLWSSGLVYGGVPRLYAYSSQTYRHAKAEGETFCVSTEFCNALLLLWKRIFGNMANWSLWRSSTSVFSFAMDAHTKVAWRNMARARPTATNCTRISRGAPKRRLISPFVEVGVS